MSNDKLLLYASVLAICWVLYKLITFFIYRQLKKKLANGDLHTFTDHLGEDYVFRFLSGEVRRYKWRKGLFIVKASFDRQDMLTHTRISGFDFFALFTRVIFN